MKVLEKKTIGEAIRIIPDWPKDGINFLDITTVLKDSILLNSTINLMAEMCADKKIDKIVGIDARGFIFASALAYKLNTGLVLARKAGKLPGKTVGKKYGLEYGDAEIEIHEGAISEGENILIVDDVLATGGTVKATIEIVEELRGNIAGLLFFAEIDELNGREKIKSYTTESLIHH